MIERIFDDLGLREAELSVVLCDDSWIAGLNLHYLGRPGPTNVLSFPMSGDDSEGIGDILGDVVVNVDRAWTDSREAGIDPLSEVAFLIIHGICHLAGYDHEGLQAHRSKEMEELEDRLHRSYSSILSCESGKGNG